MGFVLVATAGGLGAGTRFLGGSAVHDRLGSELPWGTAAVNVLGALLLGILTGWGGTGPGVDAAAGFLAGFTTFSTWMIETVHLWLEGSGGRRRAAVNVGGMLVAALAAATIGVWVGETLA